MAGTIYGVALNDGPERERLGGAFGRAPYKAPPRAPVLYIKPAACRTASGAALRVPEGLDHLQASATYALLFGGAPGVIGGAALALDVSEPQRDYYRPAVLQQGRDGFLPLGPFRPWPREGALPDITAHLNDDPAQRWRADRLVRDVETLITEIAAFMTLSDGDILLVGLQVDPITVRPGAGLRLEAHGYPPLEATFAAEGAA